LRTDDANSGDRRRLTRALPALAIALCALGLASPSRAGAASGPDAVVLVSGFTTTTPFTTPAAQCQGTDPRGETWSYEGAQLAAAGYRVYTAPVNDGAGAVKQRAPSFSGCPAQLPASMTINSVGDIYANARALASFVAHLHSAFGVNTVRFVDHSYGGLWTRGAMRLASSTFPNVQVLSLTTLGTPHLGSFLADIAEAVDPSLCGSDLTCKVIAYSFIAFRDVTLEPGLSQLTAASLAQWNPGQGTSLNATPLTAIAGDAVTFPTITDTYVSPNDVLVGLASAQADGLDKAGVIPQLSCFSPFPDVHSNTFLPLFPGRHSLLNDPGIVTDVEQTLAGNPPVTTCPNPARRTSSSQLFSTSTRTLTVPLRATTLPRGRTLPTPTADDAIILLKGSSVACGSRALQSFPFFGSTRLRVIPAPACRAQLRITGSTLRVLYLRRTSDVARLRIRGQRIFVQIHRRAGTRLLIAVKQGHRFRPVQLGPAGSLTAARTRRTMTLRLSLVERSGRAEVAAVTVHL
jgi:triacylglycerol lipase